jgi:hypothetical protein
LSRRKCARDESADEHGQACATGPSAIALKKTGAELIAAVEAAENAGREGEGMKSLSKSWFLRLAADPERCR